MKLAVKVGTFLAFCSLGLGSKQTLAQSQAPKSDVETGAVGVGGYFKTFGIGILPKTPENAPASYDPGFGFQWLNAARLNTYWRPLEKLKLELGYEIQPVVQAGTIFTSSSSSLSSVLPLVRGASYRIVDLNTLVASSNTEFRLFQNLDRVVAHWELPFGDLTIGRQAITFGSARAIQATDVLLPFSFQQLNVEYRIGVDGVRFQIPFSQMGEVDVGVVAGRDGKANESAAFARIKASPFETDLVLMVMSFSGSRMVGGGIQRGIWQLGYSLDWAQVWADSDQSYFRLSTGLDYSFESGLMFFTEYHYNGAGTPHASAYSAQMNLFAYQRGGVFLLGRNYIIPGVSYPITPLLGAHLQAMVNADDGSLFSALGFEYSLTESLYLDLGGFITLGKVPSITTSGVLLQSEFGSYPMQIYGDLRLYF